MVNVNPKYRELTHKKHSCTHKNTVNLVINDHLTKGKPIFIALQQCFVRNNDGCDIMGCLYLLYVDERTHHGMSNDYHPPSKMPNQKPILGHKLHLCHSTKHGIENASGEKPVLVTETVPTHICIKYQENDWAGPCWWQSDDTWHPVHPWQI